MSFRIDDILKSTVEAKSECHQTIYPNEECSSRLFSGPPTTSILEQTLLNKNYLCNYSLQEGAFNKFCPSDKLVHGHIDPYLNSVVSSSSLMPHDPLWSSYLYPSYPRMVSCSHYIKRKGGQVRFTSAQTEALEQRFSSHKYLSPEDRRRLADVLRLSDRQVKTWFQNRRAKWRRSNQSGNITETNSLQRKNVIIFHHNLMANIPEDEDSTIIVN